MTVTDQQLQAIAFLAVACRPHGARHWDADGVYKNLAKIRDRSLGSLTIAAIQAAEDRNAATPGVIPTAGPHWRTPESAPPQRQTEPSEAMCAGCGQTRDVCELRRSQQTVGRDDPRYDDHTYKPVAAARAQLRPTEANAMTAAAVKEHIEPTRAPIAAAEATKTTPGAGRARVEQATTSEETADA